MRIFITGASGFIGTNLVQHFINYNHDLLINIRKKKNIINHAKVKYVLGDLNNSKNWFHKVKKFQPDICINLSWHDIPNYSYKNCLKNYEISIKFIDLIKQLKLKKIIFTGSCMEYGNNKGKIDENSKSLNPNIFGFTKNLINEYLFKSFNNKKTKIVWTRLFYVYGPGQRNESLIPFVIKNLKNNKMPILENPHIANDYIFIEDLIEALFLLIIKNVKSGIYNIGNGKKISNHNILMQISKYFNVKIKKNVKNNTGFFADISKIRKVTGWNPKTTISKGIIKTIKSNLY